MNESTLKQKYHLKGSPTSGLIMATFGFFIGFAAVSLYGPVASKLKELLGISGLLLGLLVAAPNLSGSLLRIPFAAWVDKVGGKKPLGTLLILAVIGMAGLSAILLLYYPDFSKGMYWLIVFFGILSGCGIATFSVGIAQTSYWFPQKKQGIALGSYAGIGNTAPGIFGILLPFALRAFGLPVSYLIWFGLLLVGTIIYLGFVHDAYYFQLVKKGVAPNEAEKIARALGQELFPSGSTIESLKISAKIPGTWGLVLLYFTSFGGFLALTGWFPVYWAKNYGFNLREAALLMAFGFSLLASVIRVYGGHLSDKFGGEFIAILSYVTVLLGAVILIFSRSFGISLTGEIIIGAGMGVGNAAVFKLVPKYVPRAPGGAAGWVGGLGAFGGFVVPPILGVFVDHYGVSGYAKGFVVYVVLALISIITAFILLKVYNPQKKKA